MGKIAERRPGQGNFHMESKFEDGEYGFDGLPQFQESMLMRGLEFRLNRVYHKVRPCHSPLHKVDMAIPSWFLTIL